MQDELLKTLLKIARDTLDEDDLEFEPETPFEEIEAWDSLNHIHMVVRMEKEFGVRFDLADLQNLQRVGDLLAIVERLQHI